MPGILNRLIHAGLSPEQAIKTLQATYQWFDQHYPVLAKLSETLVFDAEGIPVPGSKPASRDERKAEPTQRTVSRNPIQ